MINSNNLNILPWYDSLDKQDYKKWYVFGQIWPLICSNTALLPFQFVYQGLVSSVSSISVHMLETGGIIDTGIEPTFINYENEGYAVVMVSPVANTFSQALPEGRYYATFTVNGETVYSEAFTAMRDTSKCLKIEYWNDEALAYNKGRITYDNNFKYILYVQSSIGKPIYEFEEELTKRAGYKFLESQTVNKVYNFTFVAPEFICDAMRLLRMSDYVKITAPDDSFNSIYLSYEVDWQDQGNLAAVKIEFETDTIIQKLSGFNKRDVSAFYNALLVNINEPLLFDVDVVAQYYNDFKATKAASSSEDETIMTGRLIRELDEIAEIGEDIDAFIPVDLGTGAARKYKLKKILDRLESDKFLKRLEDDTAQGVILFAKKIGSLVFVKGWDGKGWEINEEGVTFVDSVNARQNVFVKNRAGSHIFVSGLPNGVGWDIAPYKQINAAGVEETKYRLEIDDINIRGKLRAYEFIISQLRGENDNVIFAGMMKVDHYDEVTRRIYLDTEEGILYNPFRVGDILMVQRYGGMPTQENDYNVIKQYELRVAETGIGSLTDGEKRLDWITFSNFVGDLADISRGDVLTRVDSVTDLTRKGIVKVTTIDEIGAPYIDVVYGMKTDAENATKARVGNLTGIRTKAGIDLTGIWGIYGNGAYFENSTYILDNGQTIEQQFSIMNGEFNSYIKDIKNNMSLEPGNILRNSAFSDNLDYWVTADSISFWGLDNEFIYANENFISEKSNVSDIIADGTRNVLRINNSYVLQRNQVMNFLPHENEKENKYSFSLFYKAITAGTLIVGIDGSEDFYIQQEMQPTTEYQKISKIANWDESGDFKISYTGEIYIYGVSLFYDEIANATIHLETLIQQNAEQIKLAASKEYVDEQTGEVLKSVEAELSILAGEIALKASQSDIDEATGLLKTELESKISIEAGRITAVSTEIDDINNTILSAGWITASDGNLLFASKTLEDGNKIISYINQTATTTTINAKRINLQGAVTYSDLDSSLQDKVDAAGGEALDKALEAYNKAMDAYNLANSANSAAEDADTAASNAYTKAAEALTSAANALEAANEAQTSVDSLPGWSKEKDIITALEDATVIINGYIATSMIDVDNLYAKKLAAIEGTIGAFSISADRNGLETYDPNAFIAFQGSEGNFIFMNTSSSAAHFQVNSTLGTALAAISTTGTALYSEGAVKMKNINSRDSNAGLYPLYTNINTGEVFYLTT